MTKCLKDFLSVSGEGYTVFHGSNLDVLPLMADNSVDSIVTDPPYELGFMGKSWDSSGIAYSVELWAECLRVLKPGGHLLAFGGSRTWHRLAVAIEDAGFDVRDSIAWLYGSGFPKSLDVAKAIDKQSGYEGEVIGTETVDVGMQGGSMHAGRSTKLQERQIKSLSPEAEKWAGWGTALKPAFEPVVVARKPLIGTVAENVLTWGVGGLNIDGSRIAAGENENFERPVNFTGQHEGWSRPWQETPEGQERNAASRKVSAEKASTLGRWPANIIFDEYSAELLDQQADASRFFYVAKASKRDRNEGLDGLEAKASPKLSGGDFTAYGRTNNQNTIELKNFHPTVKPTDLMRYLIKLVTPAGGTVLDPFTGSGSTGKAALLDGYKFIGIELTADYLPMIEGRLKWAAEQANKQEEEKEERLF